jgi:hypothetical protein
MRLPGITSSSRIESLSSTAWSDHGSSPGRWGTEPVATRMKCEGDLASESVRRALSGDLDVDLVRPDQVTDTADDLDARVLEGAADAVDLEALHGRLAGEQLRDEQAVVDGDAHAVHLALIAPRQEERGLTQRLRRERAGVDGGAAGVHGLLDDEHPLAEVGGGDGAALPRGAEPMTTRS